MKISELATASGLNPKTIRYYENIGLIKQPSRALNGYRNYTPADVTELVFVKRCRDFGFSLDECRSLLQSYHNPNRRSAEVHQLISDKIEAMEGHIRDLQTTRGLLRELQGHCANDERSQCAILDGLAEAAGVEEGRS